MDELLALREREKELNCLYRINSILSRRGEPPARTFLRVLEAMPSGWRYPASTGARIDYLGRQYVGPGYSAEGRRISEPIRLWSVEVGRVEISDAAEEYTGSAGAFLDEEIELLRNISARLSEYLEWKQTELLGGRVTAAADHWRWRQDYAESLAASLDAERFGVSRLFLGGSTETGEAKPASDIDLYVLFHGSEDQRQELALWFEGWSLCLAELASRQTGFTFKHGILDVHWLDHPPGFWGSQGMRELSVGPKRALDETTHHN